MNSVKINKTELLARLVKNREQHTKLYKAAEIGYRKKAIAKMAALLKQAQRGGEIVTVFRMPEPVNNSTEYNRVIAMLEMSVDEVIELTSHQFNSYVLDQWEWSGTVIASNLGYVSKKFLK